MIKYGEHVKIIIITKGRAWDESEGLEKAPLIRAKGEKFPDRVSGPFIQVLKIITNLAIMDDLQLLDPYIEAMAAFGIKIDLSGVERGKMPEDYAEVMETTSNLQTHICELADAVNDKKKDFADMAICSKNNFGKIKKHLAKAFSRQECAKAFK